MASIHYFQRKRRPGQNHSLEQIFSDLRKRLASRFTVVKIESPHVSTGLFKRVANVLAAYRHQGDVNHVTGDINYINLLFKKRKTIITILDCGSLERTSGLRKWLLKIIWFQLPVMRSRFITVISQATKDHLLREVRCKEDKVKVIYVPINTEFKAVEHTFNNKKPNILQIGAAPNKNLTRLVEAAKGLDCRLTLIGKLSDTNRQLLEEYGIEYENHVDIPFEDILKHYSNCDILFFASTFEGFGMPILEAQATGRVVITSRLYSMPEVGGDAAYYVDPYNIDDIRKAIIDLTTDESYRNNLIEKGLENVKRFDPDYIASQYADLYDQILA